MIFTESPESLRKQAAGIPNRGSEVVRQARQRALEAVEIVAAAVAIDPTLPADDRCRSQFDLLTELFRQSRAMARQVEAEMARRRLVEAGAGERELARIGRTNPGAIDELDAISRRTIEVAEQVRDAALPDWKTPERIRERSAALLPHPAELKDIADRLRHEIRYSLSLAYPAPEAERLAELADEIEKVARSMS